MRWMSQAACRPTRRAHRSKANEGTTADSRIAQQSVAHACAGLRSVSRFMSGRARVVLRPALIADRRPMYEWLARSDATSAIFGASDIEHGVVPGWPQFCAGFTDEYFSPDGDGRGRSFIISEQGRNIGCISYVGLERWCGYARLVAWIGADADCGRGLGSQAIDELATRLIGIPTIEGLTARLSCENRRAIAAFEKAGFGRCEAGLYAASVALPGEAADDDNAAVLLRDQGSAARMLMRHAARAAGR